MLTCRWLHGAVWDAGGCLRQHPAALEEAGFLAVVGRRRAARRLVLRRYEPQHPAYARCHMCSGIPRSGAISLTRL